MHKTLSFCYVSLGIFFSSVNITVFQLVEVEMNKAVKRECNLKARWGTGRSGGPAPLCDCKVLYSHCLKEKVEELCDKIIEHAATRKIDLYSKDDSLYSKKKLTKMRLGDYIKYITLRYIKQDMCKRVFPPMLQPLISNLIIICIWVVVILPNQHNQSALQKTVELSPRYQNE